MKCIGIPVLAQIDAAFFTMNRYLFLIISICLSYGPIRAQRDSTRTWQIRANVQHGLLLPEYGFMSAVSDDYVNGFEINVMKLSTGKNIWEHLYRFPSFGVSFYYCTMGSKEHFGEQFTVYPYYALSIIHRNRFDLSYQMGLGVSYATKKYDPDNNYQNLAIGSHFNIHYHADVIAQYKITDRLFVNSGIAFSHISNANLSEPNVGLNFVTGYAGLAWAIGKQKQYTAIKIAPFEPLFTYEVLLNGGMKHTRTFESFQYPAVSISFDAKRRARYKFAFGVGVDFFYDASTEPQMKRLNKPYRSSDSFTSGIHLSQEFIYNKVSLIVQEGFYLGLTEKLNGYAMYNRAITRYKFSEHFFVNFSLKSHLYILDFPELGIGYYW